MMTLQKQLRIKELEGEVERLTGCLAKANSNHEEFERKWYLACDERDAALVSMIDMQKSLDAALVDARRYQWLIDFGKSDLWTKCAELDSYDEVEAAIDGAMKCHQQ